VAAGTTARVKLGTAIAVAFPRSPMILAHIAWDLQAASDGRFILGLGTQVKGHNERRFSVKWEAPGPRIREVVLALRAIWDCWQNGTKLDFRGQFYRFDLMTPFFNPGPIKHPNIPVYIAGVNQYICRVAGEVCDGLHVHPFNSPKYLREFVHPAVEEGLQKSGRKRSDFTYATFVFVVLGDTDKELAETRQTVKQQIAFYASTRTYEPVLAAHGWQDLAPKLHRKSIEGDWKGMADLITDEMVRVFRETQGSEPPRSAFAMLAGVWLQMGRFQEASDDIDGLVQEADPGQLQRLQESQGLNYEVIARAWQSHALWCLGRPDAAFEGASHALRLARELGQPFSHAIAAT